MLGIRFLFDYRNGKLLSYRLPFIHSNVECVTFALNKTASVHITNDI